MAFQSSLWISFDFHKSLHFNSLCPREYCKENLFKLSNPQRLLKHLPSDMTQEINRVCKDTLMLSLTKDTSDTLLNTSQKRIVLSSIDIGAGGTGGMCPLRFCNKQRSALFIQKMPLFLKEKRALEMSCPPKFEMPPTSLLSSFFQKIHV